MGSDRIAVFAGTSEGYEIARFLKEKKQLERADFYVATDYGRTTFDDLPEARVICGRLDPDGMRRILKQYALVIDATHPYAELVTKNLTEVCSELGIRRIRVIREELSIDMPNVTTCASTEEAAALLDETEERFLLTTGAKELRVFSGVHDFSERAVARVLPSAESLAACEEAGVLRRNTIGMQGPFTQSMNRATMEQYGLEALVTKSTGKAGGFRDKAVLAEEGYHVYVIGRPLEEEGCTLKEVKERLEKL